MLVDTTKLQTVQTAHQGIGYTPSDYAHDKRIFAFRLTWDGDEEGDILTYTDALDFVATFPGSEDGTTKEELLSEARELLDSEHAFRLGPDEDWYLITPLPEPMTHDRYGELVAVDDLKAA